MVLFAFASQASLAYLPLGQFSSKNICGHCIGTSWGDGLWALGESQSVLLLAHLNLIFLDSAVTATARMSQDSRPRTIYT